MGKLQAYLGDPEGYDLNSSEPHKETRSIKNSTYWNIITRIQVSIK